MKKIILGLVVSFIATTSVAQMSFNHALGVGVIGGEATVLTLFYSPRLNIVNMGENLTMSIGTHLGIGANFTATAGSGSTTSSSGGGGFGINAPLMLEMNFGNSCNPENEETFGAFGGLGFSYAGTTGSNSSGSSASGSGYGPTAGGGIRLMIAEQNLGLRGSYMLNMKTAGSSALNVEIFMTF